jgi:hypothetical protein
LFFAAALACLCGCNSLSGPRGKQTAATRQNRPTIVLARIVCTNDPPLERPQTYNFNLDTWRLDQPDGRMDPSPQRVRLSQRSLSKSLRDQGWFYVLMDPGNYCLKITPTSGNPTDSSAHTRQPVYYLSLPANKQFVYAGTVIFHPQVKKLRRRDLFEPNKETEYWLAGTQDEIQLAKNVAGTGPAGAGEMTPLLLVSYDSPEINSDQAINVESKYASSASAVPVVSGNNWYWAGVASSPFVYSGLYLVGAAGNASGDGAGYVAAAGAALILAAAPVALTTGGITAEIHRKKWAQCEAALRKEVETFHPEEKFQQALASRLGASRTNSTALPALRLEVQPYRIALRGDEHQQFSLEMATRVRLSDQTGGGMIWEHNYLYAPYPTRAAENTCETFVASKDGKLPLKDFQGDNGTALMRIELSSAVETIADEVISRLYNVDTMTSSESAPKSPTVTAETPPQSPH